jgi:hypothetical protein
MNAPTLTARLADLSLQFGFNLFSAIANLFDDLFDFSFGYAFFFGFIWNFMRLPTGNPCPILVSSTNR